MPCHFITQNSYWIIFHAYFLIIFNSIWSYDTHVLWGIFFIPIANYVKWILLIKSEDRLEMQMTLRQLFPIRRLFPNSIISGSNNARLDSPIRSFALDNKKLHGSNKIFSSGNINGNGLLPAQGMATRIRWSATRFFEVLLSTIECVYFVRNVCQPFKCR